MQFFISQLSSSWYCLLQLNAFISTLCKAYCVDLCKASALVDYISSFLVINLIYQAICGRISWIAKQITASNKSMGVFKRVEKNLEKKISVLLVSFLINRSANIKNIINGKFVQLYLTSNYVR